MLIGRDSKEKCLMHISWSKHISIVLLFTGLRPHFCAVLLGGEYSRRKHCVPIVRDIKFFFSYRLANVGIGLTVLSRSI